MSEPAFLSIPQLAARYGVSVDWVKVRVKQREIPFTRAPGGRLVRFTAEDVTQIDSLFLPQPALNGPLAKRIAA
ncbi:helix-turn-helix transcriptional regulator [Micromonospora chokoriensis]|uniref:helix-turn-helix transcriptional regulator n=1 Tax=Micromonospora chokoriensis TaxID=356851 RepID=UPI0004C34937|nr:helix-turn-helix domain-containing protein [Micromonospora chokoriensis]